MKIFDKNGIAALLCRYLFKEKMKTLDDLLFQKIDAVIPELEKKQDALYECALSIAQKEGKTQAGRQLFEHAVREFIDFSQKYKIILEEGDMSPFREGTHAAGFWERMYGFQAAMQRAVGALEHAYAA